MSSLASTLWIDSSPQVLGALANLFHYRFKNVQLCRARISKDFPNSGCVFAKNRRDQSFAFWGERHDADSPIFRTLDPAYQAPFDEAVNSRTDRAGRKVHLWPDRIHWQGSFVQEGLQYPEVGIVDFTLIDMHFLPEAALPRIVMISRRPLFFSTVNCKLLSEGRSVLCALEKQSTFQRTLLTNSITPRRSR